MPGGVLATRCGTVVVLLVTGLSPADVATHGYGPDQHRREVGKGSVSRVSNIRGQGPYTSDHERREAFHPLAALVQLPPTPHRHRRPHTRQPRHQPLRTTQLGGVVRIRAAAADGALWPARAGSGACSCKAEEGDRAEPWQPTTTPQMRVPDPATPARSKR